MKLRDLTTGQAFLTADGGEWIVLNQTYHQKVKGRWEAIFTLAVRTDHTDIRVWDHEEDVTALRIVKTELMTENEALEQASQ